MKNPEIEKIWSELINKRPLILYDFRVLKLQNKDPPLYKPSKVTFVISKLRQNLARFKKIELFYV